MKKCKNCGYIGEDKEFFYLGDAVGKTLVEIHECPVCKSDFIAEYYEKPDGIMYQVVSEFLPEMMFMTNDSNDITKEILEDVHRRIEDGDIRITVWRMTEWDDEDGIFLDGDAVLRILWGEDE